MKRLFFGVLLLGALSLFVACSNRQHSASDSLSVYLEALKAGDYATYSQGLTGMQEADTLAGQTLMPNLMGVYEKFMQEKYQGLKGFEIVSDSLTENGQHAILRVKLQFGNGQEEETEYEMIQEGESWKINLAS